MLKTPMAVAKFTIPGLDSTFLGALLITPNTIKAFNTPKQPNKIVEGCI